MAKCVDDGSPEVPTDREQELALSAGSSSDSDTGDADYDMPAINVLFEQVSEVGDLPPHIAKLTVKLLPAYGRYWYKDDDSNEKELNSLTSRANKQLESYHRRLLAAHDSEALRAASEEASKARNELETAYRQIENSTAKLGAILESRALLPQRESATLRINDNVTHLDDIDAELEGVRGLSLQSGRSDCTEKPKTSELHLPNDIHAGPEWYRGFSLFQWTIGELHSILERTPILNSKRFSEYLLHIITNSTSYVDDGEIAMDQKARRMFQALDEAEDGNGKFHHFHLCAELLNLHFRPEGPGFRRALIRTRMIRFMRITIVEATEYLNCAKARSTLWKRYSDFTCEKLKPWKRDRDPNCFHSWHIGLLRALQERAHIEVRNQVQVLCNGRLPQELADQIFEAALARDGVPLDTMVSHDGGPADRRHAYDKSPQVLKEYDCGRMDRFKFTEWHNAYDAMHDKKRQEREDNPDSDDDW